MVRPAIDNPATARIEIRTTPSQKEAIARRAEEAGAGSLSAFILDRTESEPTQAEKRRNAKRTAAEK